MHKTSSEMEERHPFRITSMVLGSDELLRDSALC